MFEPLQQQHLPDPAAIVEVAAALVALAMHESQRPVEDLGRSLGRMSSALGAWNAGSGARLPEELESSRALLAGELADCIRSLQFHDRLTQQLAQVRNLLASLAIQMLPAIPPAREECWAELLASLRSRFTSESHLALFDLLLPRGPDADSQRSGAPQLCAREGSIELF